MLYRLYSTVVQGEVVSASDRDGIQCLQIRVPAIHGIVGLGDNLYIKDEDLPWAKPLSPTPYRYRVGDVIYLTHIEGNYKYPVYF